MNLYEHAPLMAEHARSIGSESTSDSEAESFIESLLHQVHGALAEDATGDVPSLRLHRLTDESDPVERAYATNVVVAQDAIHVGVEFTSDLCGALLAIASYLTDNFLWQVSPPGEAAPPLEHVVTVDAFPSEALSLYAQHLIPEAESSDGYRKLPFQLLMEFLAAKRFAPDEPSGQGARVARSFPKPLADFAEFLAKIARREISIDDYLTLNRRAYFLRLHLHLMLDGLFFVMAHELAHHQLNHVGPAQSLAELREGEVAADLAALALLKDVPGFQPRSLLVVFSYATSIQRAISTEQIDHPLAGNRLLILAETLLRAPGGEALHADVNAGMSLLAGHREAILIAVGWPDEDPEELDVLVARYSDMDSAAHLLLYVDRPPRRCSWKDTWKENAFILANLSVAVTFALRDRIEPERVFATGRADYHPTVRPEDLLMEDRPNSVMTRLEMVIEAPPEWVLTRPDAELAIKSVDLSYALPDVRPRDEGRAPAYFGYAPVEVDVPRTLNRLSRLTPGQGAPRWLLLAARRYVTYMHYDEARTIYEWLYVQDEQSLLYSDLISLCGLELSLEQYSAAEAIARRALRSEPPARPGFWFVLMHCHASRGQIQEAYEYAFLEMFVIGIYGNFFEEARQYSGEMVADPVDPVMAHLREFIEARTVAEEAVRTRPEDALTAYRAARKAVLEAQRQASADFIFLREILVEIEFEICILENGRVPQSRDRSREGSVHRDPATHADIRPGTSAPRRHRVDRRRRLSRAPNLGAGVRDLAF